jgi:hypothetical protein
LSAAKPSQAVLPKWRPIEILLEKWLQPLPDEFHPNQLEQIRAFTSGSRETDSLKKNGQRDDKQVHPNLLERIRVLYDDVVELGQAAIERCLWPLDKPWKKVENHKLLPNTAFRLD